MRKIKFLFLIAFFSISFLVGQDTASYFRVGVIPYQLLSRSSGAYAGKDFGWFSLEFRATYTIPTKYINSTWLDANDRFYYQGVNNNLIVSIYISDTWKMGVLLGYRFWWYKNQWI